MLDNIHVSLFYSYSDSIKLIILSFIIKHFIVLLHAHIFIIILHIISNMTS